MLVLSRKVNEKVLLPELGITIEVVRIKGNQVRVGISAPDDIRILRGELKPVVDEFRPSPSPLPLVNTGSHPVTRAVAWQFEECLPATGCRSQAGAKIPHGNVGDRNPSLLQQ